MKVSIITVSYNSAKTIGDTISSVRKQSYKNIEYIVVDGNSTDGTVEIVKQFLDSSKDVSQDDLQGVVTKFLCEKDKDLRWRLEILLAF